MRAYASIRGGYDLVEEAGTGSGNGVADGVERPVDPAWVAVRRIGGAIAATALAVPAVIAAIVVGWVASGVPGWVRVLVVAGIACLLLALAWSVLVLPAMRYRRLRYRVDPDGLGIRRGVWWRSDKRVPRSRVQHADVTQGPVERAFGLATVIVYTAGTEHARVELDGLPEPRAREIRDHLAARSGDDGV